MLAASAGRLVGSLVFAVGITGGLVVYKKWRRRNEELPTTIRSSQNEMLSPLIERDDDTEEFNLEEMRDKIARRGKVELHSHLNGSVRRSTMNELLPPTPEEGDGIVHTIEDAFREFKKVYKVINTESSLRRVVRETLEDSLKENVRYLELRTTPRKLNDITNRRDYVRIVAEEIIRFPHLNGERPIKSFPRGTIAVRLILTVDRTQPVSVAEQTVDIALRFPDIVVGIDFAGNPTQGTFADFVSVFSRAKGHGLFITVHTSEIRGVEDETDAIVNFRPHRVGHFLFPTEEQIRIVREAGICIESCPTSNICALSGKSPVDGDMNNHSILERFIRDPDGMISICTDDPGVFDVSLSDELFAVAKTFKLNKKEIDRMILAPTKHAFLSKAEREVLASSIISD